MTRKRFMTIWIRNTLHIISTKHWQERLHFNLLHTISSWIIDIIVFCILILYASFLCDNLSTDVLYRNTQSFTTLQSCYVLFSLEIYKSIATVFFPKWNIRSCFCCIVAIPLPLSPGRLRHLDNSLTFVGWVMYIYFVNSVFNYKTQKLKSRKFYQTVRRFI